MSSGKWSYRGDFSDISSRIPTIIIDQCVSISMAEVFYAKGYRVITAACSGSVSDEEFVRLSRRYPVSIVLTYDKGRTFRDYEFAAIFPPSYKQNNVIEITEAIFGKGDCHILERKNGNGGNGNGNGRSKKKFDPKERWLDISRSFREELY